MVDGEGVQLLLELLELLLLLLHLLA